ncbi:unnamed protein product [Prunus armeniaca]
MSSRFKQSGKTISRYFNSILDGVIRLQGRLLKVPEPIPDNCTDNRWRWFKKCLGALDRTYIRVCVPEQDKPRYRTRKGEVATNVLGEGFASDSRVLRDAISRPTRLRVPTGCYYLVDDGYTNGQGYLAPYRACCLLLNLICGEMAVDPLENELNGTENGETNQDGDVLGTIEPLDQWTAWRDNLAMQIGFAWNDSLKCIEVDSDEAWNTYVQGKQCLIYDRLKNIFGKDRATGRWSATPIEMMNEPMHHIDVNDDDEEVEVEPDHSASLPRSNQQNSASSSSRHRKRNADIGIQKEMTKAFGEMISEFVDQLKTITNSLVKGSEPRPDIATELAKMDMSINDQIKALRLILEKASDERTYLTLDGTMRKTFVLLLLGVREL